MQYRNIQFSVVQTANPTGFKWTIELGAGLIKTGISHSMKVAILDAQRKIDKALKAQKPK
jgi:hypothetical protein